MKENLIKITIKIDKAMEKEKEFKIGINTILHTKDGRKIGNAIVTGWKHGYWQIKTDYGNTVKALTDEEIEDLFYIGWVDYTKEINARTCSEMQKSFSNGHKHRVNL